MTNNTTATAAWPTAVMTPECREFVEDMDHVPAWLLKEATEAHFGEWEVYGKWPTYEWTNFRRADNLFDPEDVEILETLVSQINGCCEATVEDGGVVYIAATDEAWQALYEGYQSWIEEEEEEY